MCLSNKEKCVFVSDKSFIITLWVYLFAIFLIKKSGTVAKKSKV